MRRGTTAVLLTLIRCAVPTAASAQIADVPACRPPILFDSGGRIVRVDGEAPPEILHWFDEPDRSVTKPHLSPDGQTLAWVRYRDGDNRGPAIWLMTVTGQARRPLISDGNGDQPSWSPDGTELAFTATVDGNRDIYVVRADGSDLRRLTSDEAVDEYPAWSPDGRWIAFGSLRSGDFEVYVMRNDGSQRRRVTNHPAADFRPAWSPDGSWIAFSSSRANAEAVRAFNFDMYLMRPDGGEIRQLTHHEQLALRPSWSPGSDALVYQVGGADETGQDWEIYTVDVGTGESRRLTNNRVADAHPDWNTFRVGCRSGR